MKTNEKKSVKVEMNAEELKAVSGGATILPGSYQPATTIPAAIKFFPGDLRHW